MSERTSYAPGTPCWIDLATPDQDAAAEFYGGLFGWSVEEDENADQTGGYRVATLNGQAVGGVMKLMQEGQPVAWSSYVSVEDVDATVARAKEAGGTVMVEPMSVLDYGRMAFLVDPTGAAIGLWQPGRNIGAGLVNEPGALCWNELETRDPESAKAFYGAVFGWSFEDHEMPGMGTYVEWKLEGQSIGGMADITGRVPDEVPAHWMVYFAVEDADSALDRIKELGGRVDFGPADIPAGRFGMVADPWGANFAVIKLSDEAREGAPVA
jgi:predicted enzyme related to lactoylglutathione lyase